MLVVTLVVGTLTCGVGWGLRGIVGLIEGIIYLTKTDEEFYQAYVAQRREWFWLAREHRTPSAEH